MKRNKLICLLSVVACVCIFASIWCVSVSADTSVYTLGGQSYDSESGELTYLKVEYSSNTYKTTNVTSTDANGSSVDVSDDAQYVFLPCTYDSMITDETTVSIKYKNNGVSVLPMHVEYGAGISADGMDYDSGFKYVCVDALSPNTWNVDFSKSVDGYDVLSVLFGNYAGQIYDVNVLGFRLYFDYAKTVDTDKSFEIYGVTIHESNEVPTFASDPKGCRLSKFVDKDGETVGNDVTFDGQTELTANILDYSKEYSAIEFEFDYSGTGNVEILLDGESAYNGALVNGTQSLSLDLTKDNYSTLTIKLDGAGNIKYSVNLVSKPYVDTFSGSGYTVSKNSDGLAQIKFNFAQGWYKVSAPIRMYNSNYDSLKIVLNLSHPIVIGMMIDDTYLWSHWSHTEPNPAGDISFFFDLTSIAITENSSLVIYFDPAITDYTGIAEEKTVIIKEMEFINTDKMQKATITIKDEFVFDYDGKGKSANGATSNSGATLVYEYKREEDNDKAYDESLPVDAGVYDVRVTSPLTSEYGITYAYSKLIINKITPSKPSANAVTVDYVNECVKFDSSVLVVSKYEDFSYLLSDGGAITYGMKLYFKYIDSVNYNESESSSIELNKREEKITMSIDYVRETTTQNLSTSQEYSTDGITWITGQNKKVKLEPGYIYLFRTKATSTSFASEIFYIAASHRPVLSNVDVTLSATDNSSITLNAIEGAEYKLSDTVWQDGVRFDYLKAGDKVTVYVRLKATETSFASEEITAEFIVGGQQPNNNDTNEQPSGGCGGSLTNESILLFVGTVSIVVCAWYGLRRKSK